MARDRQAVLSAATRPLWLIVALLGAAAAVHQVAGEEGMVLALLHAATDWLYLPAYLVIPAAATGRRPWLEAAALGVVAVHLSWMIPGNLGAASPGPGAALRVVTANALDDNPEKAAFLAEILDTDPDVVMLQEISSEWNRALAGLARALPYSVVRPQPDRFGVALFSRFPIEEPEILRLGTEPVAKAVVVVGGTRVMVAAMHAYPPVTAGLTRLRADQLRELRAILDDSPRPFVFAGDLNATRHGPLLHAILAGPARSAHALCGRAWFGSWPDGPVPPIGIDHVLVSPGIGCAAIREGRGPGSDHHPVIADLVIPLSHDLR